MRVRVDEAGRDDAPVRVHPFARSLAVGARDLDAPGHAAAVDKAVSVGQTVIVTNHASHPQNIYSVSDGNNFHLGSLAPGQSGEYIVQSPGLIEVVTT